MSTYGQKVLETLFASASDYDFVTVSGMAEGVDQLCHKLSHENNIPTIAVLG
jgi:predicted Rossmann fold nucleotide-binding protein DprA/Smf involved in DNA uptake